MLGAYPSLEICSRLPGGRLPWPRPPGAVLLGVLAAPHWASSRPQWAVSRHSKLCSPIPALTIKVCWAAWPEGKGWSLSSPESRCGSEEAGDDRTGETGFHTGPCELIQLDHAGLTDSGHWKTPRNENQVLFSRNPR